MSKNNFLFFLAQERISYDVTRLNVIDNLVYSWVRTHTQRLNFFCVSIRHNLRMLSGALSNASFFSTRHVYRKRTECIERQCKSRIQKHRMCIYCLTLLDRSFFSLSFTFTFSLSRSLSHVFVLIYHELNTKMTPILTKLWWIKILHTLWYLRNSLRHSQQFHSNKVPVKSRGPIPLTIYQKRHAVIC